MFTPTKNFAQVWSIPDERYAFGDAALAQAKEDFPKKLKEEGYSSVEEYKNYINEMDEDDILLTICNYQNGWELYHMMATNPDISPDKSFNNLVTAYIKTLFAQVSIEVLDMRK